MFSAIVYFFPLLTLAPTSLDISILQEKTEHCIQFYLPEKKLPTCATIPSFLFKVALLLSHHNQAMCCICHFKSITFTSGRQKKKKKTVLLNPLSPHFCIGKFTEWFSNLGLPRFCIGSTMEVPTVITLLLAKFLAFSAHQS